MLVAAVIGYADASSCKAGDSQGSKVGACGQSFGGCVGVDKRIALSMQIEAELPGACMT